MAIKTLIGSEDRLLPCPMASHERVKKGQELAVLLQDRGQLSEERKATVAQYKADDDVIVKKIATLRDVLATGIEPKQVEVELWGFHDERLVRVTRKDTGEVIETRAMTEKERQMPFDFIDDDRPAGPPAVGPEREQ